MMRITLLLLVLVGLSMQACDPSKCILPNCRCYNDPNQPGGLNTADIPQIIMISFEGTISTANLDSYRRIFSDVRNPNGCPIKGTFFIEDQGTSYTLIRNLETEGHEIGIQSVDGKPPSGSKAWIEALEKVRSELDNIVDIKTVLGVRAPNLDIGGNGELIGIGSTGMLYDSSCTITSAHYWPFTFDSMPTLPCSLGTAPDYPFPGKWEVTIADLYGKDNSPCVVPSACAGIQTKRDAFDLFFKAFNTRYNARRTPLNMVIDPAWAANDDFNAGTAEFIQYVRSTFRNDVWIVPIMKALQWVQTPTPISNLTNFAPWQCNTQDTLLFKGQL